MLKVRTTLFSLFFMGGLLFFTSCNNTDTESRISGRWSFDYIQNEEGKEMKPVTVKDYMIIGEDGTFEYKLHEADVEAKGTWKLTENKDALVYTYTEPKPVERTYVLKFPSEDKLILFEKGINYAFKK